MTHNAAHLAWCGLVALSLARQDGGIASPAQENLFLTRWLATALKQRRFSRDVAPDIEWLLKQGRQHGIRARLPEKLDYLWRSCSGELSDQNDLFRLTYALETAKDMLWSYRLLNDREWDGRYAVALNAGVNGIYLSRENLDTAFDDSGKQIKPLMARITGNGAGLVTLFRQCGWLAEPDRDRSSLHQYILSAIRNSGDVNNPEVQCASQNSSSSPP